MTVYKYHIPLHATPASIEMRWPATPVAVGIDPSGIICVWALADTDRAELVTRKFAVVGTGQPIPPDDVGCDHRRMTASRNLSPARPSSQLRSRAQSGIVRRRKVTLRTCHRAST